MTDPETIEQEWGFEWYWTPRHWEIGVGAAWGRFNYFGKRKRALYLMLGPVSIGVCRRTSHD